MKETKIYERGRERNETKRREAKERRYPPCAKRRSQYDSDTDLARRRSPSRDRVHQHACDCLCCLLGNCQWTPLAEARVQEERAPDKAPRFMTERSSSVFLACVSSSFSTAPTSTASECAPTGPAHRRSFRAQCAATTSSRLNPGRSNGSRALSDILVSRLRMRSR